MSPTTPQSSRAVVAPRDRPSKPAPHGGRRHSVPNAARRTHASRKIREPLGRYTDRGGRRREIVTCPGAGDSLLVVDRDAATLTDGRLLAHIAPDEPVENAAIVSRCFLDQARRERCVCRPLAAADLESVPAYGEIDVEPPGSSAVGHGVCDRIGRSYRLERFNTGLSIPELRWSRTPRTRPGSPTNELEMISTREAIGSLEDYDPIRKLTRRALAQYDGRGEVSIASLRAELTRVQRSSIVLNRALRAAARDAIERRGESMSAIATRCGRIKRDAAGRESGETSWLARRLGLLPEAGRDSPTPWIQSDVLALIARDGLGLSPREVEVH
jgi:hypothetical protein